MQRAQKALGLRKETEEAMTGQFLNLFSRKYFLGRFCRADDDGEEIHTSSRDVFLSPYKDTCRHYTLAVRGIQSTYDALRTNVRARIFPNDSVRDLIRTSFCLSFEGTSRIQPAQQPIKPSQAACRKVPQIASECVFFWRRLSPENRRIFGTVSQSGIQPCPLLSSKERRINS